MPRGTVLLPVPRGNFMSGALHTLPAVPESATAFDRRARSSDDRGCQSRPPGAHRPVSSAFHVHEAARLVLADIADGKPVPELRLLDAGGPVAEAAMEAFRRLDVSAIPFAVGFAQVAQERQDMYLLLLSAAMQRVLSSNTPDDFEASAFSLESVRRVAARNVNGP